MQVSCFRGPLTSHLIVCSAPEDDGRWLMCVRVRSSFDRTGLDSCDDGERNVKCFLTIKMVLRL